MNALKVALAIAMFLVTIVVPWLFAKVGKFGRAVSRRRTQRATKSFGLARSALSMVYFFAQKPMGTPPGAATIAIHPASLGSLSGANISTAPLLIAFS